MLDSSHRVAQGLFGSIALPDARLRERAVHITAACLRAPAGTITSVFKDPSEREAAYRFMDNDRVSASALMAAQAEATAKVARREAFVFVPVDGSSLTLTDRKKKRDVGRVGANKYRARGMIVVSALAVSPEGTPIGLCGQAWWARQAPGKRTHKADSEMAHSIEVMDGVTEVMGRVAPKTSVWFQLDRAYDAQRVLTRLSEHDVLFTVRASHNRRLHVSGSGKRVYVEDRLRKRPVLGTHVVELPASDGAPARAVMLDVRVLATVVSAKRSSKTRTPITLTYVDVRERGRPDGLRWTLITNTQVDTLEEAVRVVDGYTTRWRIEEYHRAWKRGVCNVEDTQLRSRQGILKWATILGAVAARATRLAYLARTKPELPVESEFDAPEVAAAVLLHRRPVDVAALNLGGFVDLVARLGGYTGKSSGGPPGATTISRGLLRVVDTACALRALQEHPEILRKMRKL